LIEVCVDIESERRFGRGNGHDKKSPVLCDALREWWNRWREQYHEIASTVSIDPIEQGRTFANFVVHSTTNNPSVDVVSLDLDVDSSALYSRHDIHIAKVARLLHRGPAAVDQFLACGVLTR
jgi:hypothetical protein